MSKRTNEEWMALVKRAVAGESGAVNEIVADVSDRVFNLSLRMLGTFPDAEDAAQEIFVKIIKGLPSFRGESAFPTWVFSVAANYLRSYRRHRFAAQPLSFEFYGMDIENGHAKDLPDQTQVVDRDILAEELKMSCTNVMLQCLDADARCVFVLGTMFHLDSRAAGEILGITPENYRQRLCRAREKMAGFLERYCGEYGRGRCRCRDRVDYAIQNHRIDPAQLTFASAQEVKAVKDAMEEIDGLAQHFEFMKQYRAPEELKAFVENFLSSEQMAAVRKGEGTNA